MAKSIAVAGKGGTGKTTIAAMIVRYLVENKMGPVLAIDADPDSNLGTLLGIKVATTVGDLRNDTLEEIKKLPAGMPKANYVEAGLHGIIEEANGFDLITMGKGEGSGCYCSLNNIIRKFHDDLLPSYKWVVMDNEAGLEHISRRTSTNIDILLTVVSANPISLDTAKKVEEITGKIKNAVIKKYVITNMVQEKWRKQIEERLSQLSMEYLGNIPKDEVIEEAIMTGSNLMAIGNSEAKDIIFKMIEKIQSKVQV
jgi:CO dehydrogenase maturation factor